MTESVSSSQSETLRQWEASRRRRGPECLSDRALDGVLTGEIRDAGLTSARAHLTGCTACAAALQALTDDRQKFLSEANLGALAADALARAAAVPARPWWRRLAPAFTATAAVAVAAILIVPRLKPPASEESDLRAKGARVPAAESKPAEAPAALSMAMFVKHTEQPDSQPGEPHWGEVLHPGDLIQLALDNDQPGKVTVLAVDATGQVSVYQPAIPLGVGRALRLPRAIQLDSTLGDELLVTVRCPADITTQAVVAAAERALNKAQVKQDPVGALGTLRLPCVEVRYAIQKIALP